MRFIKNLLIALLPFGVLGQSTVNGTIQIDLSDYVRKSEFEQMLRNAGVKPTIVLPYCDEGPELREIKSATRNGVTFQFHGVGVTGLYVKVTSATDTVAIRRVSVTPSSNTPTANFAAPLPDGVYRLYIESSMCRAKSATAPITFPIGSAGTVDPPVIVNPPDATLAKFITKGLPEHLNLDFKATTNGVIINDLGTESLSDGFTYWYFINGHVVKQKTRLKNYKYESRNPIRVMLMQGRDGLDTFNRWDPKGANEGYYSQSAGASFTYNVSAAYYLGVFSPVTSSFVSAIPAKYNPDTRQTQWMDILGPITLPKDRILITERGEWSATQYLAAGPSHISIFKTPSDVAGTLMGMGKTYNEVPRLEHFLNLQPIGPDISIDGYNRLYWPNGELKPDEAYRKGKEIAIHAVHIGETNEGKAWIPREKEMWRNVYKGLRENQMAAFEAKGIPSYACHDYGTSGQPSLLMGSREELKAVARNPLGKYTLWVTGPLQYANLLTSGVYADWGPDLYQGLVPNAIYQLANIKKVGKTGIVFVFPEHEWRPNNLKITEYPDGTYYQYDKIPLDPNITIGLFFVGNIWGQGGATWGAPGKQTDRKTDGINRDWLWFPKGSNTNRKNEFPHNGGTYAPYIAGSDLAMFGAKLYADTFAQTEGGELSFLRHRIDGGTWVIPSQTDMDEIVDSYFDKRGFAVAQTKGSTIAWFYNNPFADNLEHDLEVELPGGQIIKEKVASNAILAQLRK